MGPRAADARQLHIERLLAPAPSWSLHLHRHRLRLRLRRPHRPDPPRRDPRPVRRHRHDRVVAKALGRRAHLVDLSADYCRLARWRVNDPKELAKAAQVKPPKPAKKAKVTKLRPKPAEAVQESLLDDGSAA
jgi:hypothetical protein